MKRCSKTQLLRYLRVEQLEKRHMLSSIDVFFPPLAGRQQPDFADIAFETEVVKKPSAWRLDANNDDTLSPSDALTRINLLNTLSQPIYVDKSFEQGLWDATGDGQLAPDDVLATITALNIDLLWGSIENTHDISVTLTEKATTDISVGVGTIGVIMSQVDIMPSDFVFVDIAESFSRYVSGDINRVGTLRLTADYNHDGAEELLGLATNLKTNDHFVPTTDSLIPLEPNLVTTFFVRGDVINAYNPTTAKIGIFQPMMVTYSGGNITSTSIGTPHTVTFVNPKPTITDTNPIEVRLGDTDVLMASAVYAGSSATNMIQFFRIHVTGGTDWLTQDFRGKFWSQPTLYDATNDIAYVSQYMWSRTHWNDTEFYDAYLVTLAKVGDLSSWEVRGTFADNATYSLFVGHQCRVELLDMNNRPFSVGPWNTFV